MSVPDLCTLQQVKTFLGITDDSSDAVITSLIPGVSQQLLNAMNRLDLLPNIDYVDYLPAPVNSCRLFLKHYPVTEVLAVSFVGGDDLDRWNESIPTDSGWRFVLDPNPENQQFIDLYGLINGQCCPMCWPATCFPNISVSYKAGYDEVPAAIEQAAIEWICFKRNQAQMQAANPVLGNLQIGDFSQGTGGGVAGKITDYLSMQMPGSVAAVIEQYMRWTV